MLALGENSATHSPLCLSLAGPLGKSEGPTLLHFFWVGDLISSVVLLVNFANAHLRRALFCFLVFVQLQVTSTILIVGKLIVKLVMKKKELIPEILVIILLEVQEIK